MVRGWVLPPLPAQFHGQRHNFFHVGPYVYRSRSSTTDSGKQSLEQSGVCWTTSSSWEEVPAQEVAGVLLDLETAATEDSSDGTNDQDSQSSNVDPGESDTWRRAVEKASQSLQKKKNSLERELEKVEQIESKTARANLIKSNLYLFPKGVRSATVQDWETGESVELEIDPAYDSAVAEVEALFAQLRKIRRGSEVVERLLKETTEALDQILQLEQILSRSIVEDDLQGFQLAQERLVRSASQTQFTAPTPDDDSSSRNSKSNSNPRRSTSRTSRRPPLGSPASNIRKLKTPAGSTVLVGRNRRGNEYLSLHLAQARDLWLHARGTPGAHVLVRGGGTEDCRQWAAHVAAFYSDARSERNVLVTATAAKHLSKPRGAPLGAVQVRLEEAVVTGCPESVPEELRHARAASGQDEGYRAANKAKLRKQNRQRQEAKRKAAKRKAKEAR